VRRCDDDTSIGTSASRPPPSMKGKTKMDWPCVLEVYQETLGMMNCDDDMTIVKDEKSTDQHV